MGGVFFYYLTIFVIYKNLIAKLTTIQEHEGISLPHLLK